MFIGVLRDRRGARGGDSSQPCSASFRKKSSERQFTYSGRGARRSDHSSNPRIDRLMMCVQEKTSLLDEFSGQVQRHFPASVWRSLFLDRTGTAQFGTSVNVARANADGHEFLVLLGKERASAEKLAAAAPAGTVQMAPRPPTTQSVTRPMGSWPASLWVRPPDHSAKRSRSQASAAFAAAVSRAARTSWRVTTNLTLTRVPGGTLMLIRNCMRGPCL